MQKVRKETIYLFGIDIVTMLVKCEGKPTRVDFSDRFSADQP